MVETEWLEGHLEDIGLRVFDCTVMARLNPEPGAKRPFVFESGRAGFDEGHVPGAGFLDLLGDLSDPSSGLPYRLVVLLNLLAVVALAWIHLAGLAREMGGMVGPTGAMTSTRAVWTTQDLILLSVMWG